MNRFSIFTLLILAMMFTQGAVLASAGSAAQDMSAESSNGAAVNTMGLM